MIDKVLASEVCIGCGACTAVNPAIKMTFNRLGDLVAQLPEHISESELRAASAVCPFSNPLDENEIATTLFSTEQHHSEIGYFASMHAAYAPAYRKSGSSGGVVTWLLCHLLKNRLVDGVIHVGRSNDPSSERFFDFRLSSTDEEVVSGSTSFYYPVSMDRVLDIVKKTPGRYAITGVPCFHKALRLLKQHDEVIRSRVIYQIGIACGQMKSAHYMEYLAGHANAKPPIESACFRRKIEGRPANDYAFEVVTRTDQDLPEIRQVLNSKIGANWGMGYFKPEACEFCDDVLAETADVCAMDAWLPQYVKDSAGWSLLVARDPEMLKIINHGIAQGELVVEETSTEAVIASQRSGFSHRRGALPYRLWMKRGKWLPIKRQTASTSLHPLLRIEQRIRELLRVNSRRLWLETGHLGDFAGFQQKMKKYILLNRAIGRIKRILL